MRKILFLAFVVNLLSSQLCRNVHAQNAINEIDSLFSEIQKDTLHVYTGMVQTMVPGNPIPFLYIESFKFYKKGISYYCLNKLYIDKEKKYKAYLLKSDGNTYRPATIYIVVYKSDSSKLIFATEIAIYQLMSTAFERTQNAWISDFDGDGNKDIGIYSQMIDFEMSTDESPNTSKSEHFIYLFKNGKYEMEIWNLDILKNYPLIKGK